MKGRKMGVDHNKVLLELVLELLDKVIDKVVIEVFSTNVEVTGGGFDYEDALLNGQKRNIEDVPLISNLHVKTICDGRSHGLIDNAKDIETTNCASILCGLTLRVACISWNGDDGIRDHVTEV